MEATMGKMDIKELMAQTREIARQPSKQTEKEDTEPVTVPETDSQSTGKITVPEGLDSEEACKRENATDGSGSCG
jgi:hypothetical protein